MGLSATSGKLTGVLGRLAFSGPAVDCTDNPCDPTCHHFVETPAGGLVAEPDPSGATTRLDGTLVWQGGSALDVPAIDQGGVCFSADDCSYGQRCANVATDPACAHNKCEPGASLSATCDSCVEQICQEEPDCCTDGESSWSTDCVALVDTVCHSYCDTSQPAAAAHCTEWTPGETNPDCDGYDLALGIPCTGAVPVCNHGTVEVPAGVTLMHFPAGSVDLSSCAPGPDAPDAVTCTTHEPIRPGRCISVTDCSGPDEPRDILVNPEGPGHLEECSCRNNSIHYVPGMECLDAPSCFATRIGRAPSPNRLHAFFVAEQSGRMLDADDGIGWAQLQSGLKALFRSRSAAGADVALELFPSAADDTGSDGCYSDGDCTGAVAECSHPAVPFGMLSATWGSGDAQESALLSALADATPFGVSPVAAALEGALTTMRDASLAAPSDTYAVVLVGTGMPDVCVTDSSYLVALADYFHQQWGILTFTVALDGADVAVMDAIADAGGTRRSRIFANWDASPDGRALLQDLIDATGAAASTCTVELGNAEHSDPTRAVVRYLDGDGAWALHRVADAEHCAADWAGWYYDDPSAPTSLTLCPTACSSLKADPGAEVRVELPCLGDPSAVLLRTTVSEVYPAVCPEGTRVQWGFMGYSASTPSDSRVILYARTADQQDELAAAEMTKLTEVAAAWDNQECEIASGCYIDLFDMLEGVPDARRPFLELQVKLVPSTYNETPVLSDWQITYSCPASV